MDRHRAVAAASFAALLAFAVPDAARAQDPAERFVGTWRRDDGRLYRFERGPSPGEISGELLDPPTNATFEQSFRVALRLKVSADHVRGSALWSVANPKRGLPGEPDELAAVSQWDLVSLGSDRLAGEVEWLEWEDGHVKTRGTEKRVFDRIPVVSLAAEDGRGDRERIASLEGALAAQQLKIDALEKRVAAAPTVPSAVDEAKKTSPSAPQFEWGYNEGFFVRGQIHDATYEIRPRARLQLDYRAFPHSSANDVYQQKPPQDEFLVRRARVGFDGSFTQYFAFDFEADPSRNSSTQLLLGDFWFEFRPLANELRFRFGHFKTPITLDDGMTSDLYLDMVERPMIVGSGNQLAPDFRPGAEVYGAFAGGVLKYWISCQNQPDSATVASGDPLSCARLASEFLGIELGVGGCWENRSGRPADKVAPSGTQLGLSGQTPGQFQFFAPVQVRGWTERYEVDLSVYEGPLFARGELGYVKEERFRVLADHTNGTDLSVWGATGTFGFLFWAPVGKRDQPLAVPFQDWQFFSLDAIKRKNGRNVGLELVTRLEYVSFDYARSRHATDDQIAPNDCRAVSVGLNLFPIENVRFMADWVHLRIGDQARAEKAHSRFADEFLMRAQLEF
jgi:hypothetical protein